MRAIVLLLLVLSSCDNKVSKRACGEYAFEQLTNAVKDWPLYQRPNPDMINTLANAVCEDDSPLRDWQSR